jgi:transcriptional regulator with XRE-family HTH domain
MKKCDVCGSALESRRTNREAPYAYAIGGLPRVGLVGITVHRCATCDVDAPVIPKPGELHRLLTKLFLQKPGLLAGDELRFLRKHAGMPAQQFSALLGVDPAHLSRVENGKIEALGATSDRLARAIVSALVFADNKDGQLVRDVLLRAAEEGPKGIRRPLVKMDKKKNRWVEETPTAA